MMRKIFHVSTILFCYVILIIGTSCTESKRITKNSKEFNRVEVYPLSGNPEKPFATMTPEEIRAYEIGVMRKIADLTLIPPKLNTSPLPEFDYDNLDYGMTIGIERTPKGRLWAAWVAGCDCPRAFMVANTSDDNGETWSKPRLVINSQSPNLPLNRSVIVGSLWTDPSGKLWFFFDQVMHHYDGRGGLWASFCENPDDENPVWSTPKRIWHGSMLNKPIVLSTGEWLLPVQLRENKGHGPFNDIFPELDPFRGVNVFISRNKGKTFERHSNVRFSCTNWPEPMIIERKDGSLWMLARTGNGIMESTSSDRGKTWSTPFSSSINHPVARFHIRRLASGKILLVKHGETIDTHEGRSKLTAWLSEDDGTSWKGGLMLDERSGISYPDGTQAPDGTIYITYDRERSALGEILMARITENDILAGKLVTPGSKLKMLVSRPMKNRNE